MGSFVARAFWFIVIIGVLVWAVQSGVVGKGISSFNSSSTFSFFPSFPTSHTSTGSPAPQSSGGSWSWTNTGSSGQNQNQQSGTQTINPSDIPPGYVASQLSPYFHKIRFGGMSAGSFYNIGTITINTWNVAASTSVDVTGWHIQANHGGEYIPQAINYYDPLGLNAPSDIRLKSGDVLYLYSTSAPANLRANKCMGYLPQAQLKQYNPSLPQNCPYIDLSQYRNLSGSCQNYISSLGCRTPDMSDPRIPVNDYNCVNILQYQFNYRWCYDNHQFDKDFISNEVRVYMGSSPIDASHDIVQLFDRKGLLVDYYSY